MLFTQQNKNSQHEGLFTPDIKRGVFSWKFNLAPLIFTLISVKMGFLRVACVQYEMGLSLQALLLRLYANVPKKRLESRYSFNMPQTLPGWSGFHRHCFVVWLGIP